MMMIKNATLAFEHLHKADSGFPGADPKFSGSFILEDGDPQVEKIRTHINGLIKEKLPDADPRSIPIALRPGSEKPDTDGFGDGTWFFNASSKHRPGLYNKDRTPLTEADGRPYSGCKVNARVDFWVQNNSYGKRVNCSLSGVQFVEDGTPFTGGGRPAQAEDFDLIEETSFLD